MTKPDAPDPSAMGLILSDIAYSWRRYPHKPKSQQESNVPKTTTSTQE